MSYSDAIKGAYQSPIAQRGGVVLSAIYKRKRSTSGAVSHSHQLVHHQDTKPPPDAFLHCSFQ